MLAGVLLHVVEAARPVDDRRARLASRGAGVASTCAMRSPSSTTSVTAMPPSVPVSNGWPPEVG